MKNFVLIFIFLINLSCSKNFNKYTIKSVDLLQTAKISGKHIIHISKKKFIHNKQIVSEDCESWALNLNFDTPLRESIKYLLDDIFVNYEISKKKLSKTEIKKKGYVSQISFSNFNGTSSFKTEKNTGKYYISLNIKIEVENSNKNIVNKISSNTRWEKNIFLNCNLQKGAVESSQLALENLIKKSWESSYKSVNQIKR